MSFFVVFFSTFFLSSHHLSAVICRQIPMQHLTPAGRPIPPGPSRPSSIQQFHLFFIQGFLAFHRLPTPTHTQPTGPASTIHFQHHLYPAPSPANTTHLIPRKNPPVIANPTTKTQKIKNPKISKKNLFSQKIQHIKYIRRQSDT